MGKVYISGPMTGIQDFNYPAFHLAEKNLKDAGFEVENPARNPDPTPKTWEGFMRLSIKQICECEHVALLPGWEKSRGAVVEVQLAKTLGMTVKPIEDFLS